jgi:hypothetical protein
LKTVPIVNSYQWQFLQRDSGEGIVLFGYKEEGRVYQFALEGWSLEGKRKWRLNLVKGSFARLGGVEELKNGNWLVALDSMYIVSPAGKMLHRSHYRFAFQPQVFKIFPQPDGGFKLLLELKAQRNAPVEWWVLTADAHGNETSRVKIECDGC